MVCRVFLMPYLYGFGGIYGEKRELGRADGDLSLSVSARIARFAL